MSSKFTPFKFFPTQVHSLGEWKVVRWNHVSIFKLTSNSFCLYLLIPIAGSFIVGRIISEKNRFVLFLIGRELSNSCPHIYDQLLRDLVVADWAFPFHCMQSPSSAEDEILFVFGGWPLNPDRSLASGEKWSNITTTCFRFTTFSSSRCMSSRCRDWFLSEEMAVSIKRRIWTPNRRELKLWEVVLVLTVVARFGGKINKSTHRGRDWGLTRHSCKIHHRIQEKHVKPSLWKDQVERHQLAGSVCQLVSVRTIGGNEDKTIGTIPLTYRNSSSAS